MNRRELLRTSLASALFATTGLLAIPRRAFAMGGTLPSLDQPAPPFQLEGVAPGAGNKPQATRFDLSNFAGSWLVLYFYPKDFTGGCTLEARRFQTDLAAYRAANAQVVGVSADDANSHAAFCDQEGLAFPLLADPGGVVSRRYGSWIPPFSQRHSFLIDPQGVLRARWVGVQPSSHSSEVLAELKRLQNV